MEDVEYTYDELCAAVKTDSDTAIVIDIARTGGARQVP